MSDLKLCTSWTLHGLRALVFENRLLQLVVLPEAGGKLWQIRYKPHDADLLWNHPRIQPARHSIHARYDDVWSGGMDELFPNDDVCTLEGEPFPDHGELWTGAWQAEPFQTAEKVGVRLTFVTPISAFAVEKIIALRPGSSRIEISYKLTNQGQGRFPFLWKLHPAFAVTPHHRIDFPAMQVLREPGFPGTLGEAPLTFPWPCACTPNQAIDLRRVPDTSNRAVHFFYGTEMAAGWCALTNPKSGLATALTFDQKVFPACWLFASFGGWRNLNVAVLEPCTSYPMDFLTANRQHWLAPGETLSTTVHMTLQENLHSVGGVDAKGNLLPGDPWP
jgi:galactose mutarotase-like enzyme